MAFSADSLHGDFQHGAHIPAGRDTPVLYSLDLLVAYHPCMRCRHFSVSYNRSVGHLQQWSLTIWFGWANREHASLSFMINLFVVFKLFLRLTFIT